MAADDYFPRGNPLKRTLDGGNDDSYVKRRKELEVTEDLFGKSSVQAEAQKAKKKKNSSGFRKTKGSKIAQRRHGKKLRLPSDVDDGPASIETLTSKRIASGLLMLGCVKKVNDYGLVLGLPNNLCGSVSITDISDSYRHLLERYAESTSATESSENTMKELHSLRDLFCIGAILPCKVISSLKGEKARVKVSVNPRDVNDHLTAASLKTGTVLYGSISSAQDHGYTVDLGIAGVAAFLAKKMQNKTTYMIGEIVRLAVKSADLLGLISGDNRVVAVTAKDTSIKKAEERTLSLLPSDSSVTFRDLIPGMAVAVQVENVTDEGLYVKFAAIKGCIHRSHFSSKLDIQLRCTQLHCRLLYVDPTSKAVALTTLPHLVSSIEKSIRFPDTAKRGAILDGRVLRIYKNKALLLLLGEDIDESSTLHGYASKQHLSDNELTKSCHDFKKGTNHSCRILDFDYLEKKVMVSLKKSVLAQEFLDYANLSPGDLIQCTLRGFHKQGISVKISRSMKGFVPFLHLTDIPLRHPEKKFKKEDPLKCRVLTLDSEKKRVILTAKKSLVKSSNPPLITYSAVKKGMVVEGVIVKVMPNGCLVAFYNDVKGWVPKSQLSAELIPYPEQVFYIGQVVKCQVLSCTPGDRKLVLSFKLENLKPFGKKEVLLPQGFDIGGITECCVVEQKGSGLNVAIGPTAVQAFIPLCHLSDNHDMASQLLVTYSKGDKMRVVYFSKTGALTVTAKPSFLNAAVEKALPTGFTALKPGLLCPGVVKRILDYGLFVDLGGGLTGLCPNKYIANRYISNGSQVCQVGQTVYVKVTEVDEEKHRFLVSLRLSDCYHDDTACGLKLLRQRLLEEDRVKQFWAQRCLTASGDISKCSVTGCSVGSVITATVTDVNDQGLLLSAESGRIKALVTFENMAGCNVKAGDDVEALILCVDVEHGCLECSVQPDLVKTVKTYIENKFSQARSGQVIKAQVLLAKDGWVLCLLKAHASGRLAYLPVKRHLNDWDGKGSFHHGQVNVVVIEESVSDSFTLCTIQTAEARKDMAFEKYSTQKLPPLGSRVKAEITALLDLQMNVVIHPEGDVDSKNGLSGRVHITEVCDSCHKDVTSPLASYSIGDIVDAVLIGYREVKVKSTYLRISRPYAAKRLAELSVKPSRLAEAPASAAISCPSPDDCRVAAQSLVLSAAQCNKGDKIIVYAEKIVKHYLHVKVSLTVSGVVPWWNLSSDNSFAQGAASATSVFRPGSGHLATVMDVRRDGCLELSLTGDDCQVLAGKTSKAMVTGSTSVGVYVSLPHGFLGKVPLTEISDGCEHKPWLQFSEGDIVDCHVLSSHEKHKCVVSLRKSRFVDVCSNSDESCHVSQPTFESPLLLHISDLTPNVTLRGYVTQSSDKGVFVAIGPELVGRADLSHASKQYILQPEVAFFQGMCVWATVLSTDVNGKHVDLSFLEDHTGRPEPVDAVFLGQSRQQTNGRSCVRKSTAEVKGSNKAKKRLRTSSESRNADEEPLSRKLQHKVSKTAPAGNAAGTPVTTQLPKSNGSTTAGLPPVGFDWHTTLSSVLLPPSGSANAASNEAVLSTSTSSTAMSLQQTGSACTPAMAATVLHSNLEVPVHHKKASGSAVDAAEARLYEAEQRLASGENETADDYERLVRQSPDSSMIWLSYVSYCLSTAANVEAARSVAERALTAISYREEQERMNVWSAYMALESMYGTADSLQVILSRALQHMDPLKVYQKLIAIHVAASKMEAAEGIHLMLTKKYSKDKDVWLNCGLFYFKNDKAESGRQLMHRSLNSLDKAVHVDVLAKFAQIEYKYGSVERGRTLFETLLSTYPKRSDLWSIYIDMVTKQAFDLAQLRTLFERAINQNFAPKTVKFFFKKYLDFEETHGDDRSAASVKKKAMDYVQRTATASRSS